MTRTKICELLIVDDEASMLHAVNRMLRNGPYLLDTVQSVDAALHAMQAKTYDLILFDYMMPKKNGITFLQEAQWDRNKTKCVLMTAHCIRSIINDTFTHGGVGYLIKPFGKDDLLRILNYYLKSDG